MVATRTVDTTPGMVLGTVGYMSPEQVRGQMVDHRADIFSFGAILYEMLSGKRAFKGETSADTMSAILNAEPPEVTETNRAIPPAFENFVRHCLEKRPDHRFQSVRDMAFHLDALSNLSGTTAEASGGRKRRASVIVTSAVAITAIVVVVIALAGGMSMLTRHQTPPAFLNELQVTPLTTSGNAEQPAISPDGKYVAYVQHDGNDYSLWIRQIATASNVQIVEPESSVMLRGPTVTPDGSFVDFVRNVTGGPSELWRIAFLGGMRRKLVENINSLGGWSPDGQHLAFVRGAPGPSTSAFIVADADASHERVLASRRRPARFTGLNLFTRPLVRPAWSPDGHLIASLGNDQLGKFDVVLVDVSTGSERIMPMPDMDISSLAWLDRTALVLNAATTLGAPRQLWRLSYPTGQLARLTNDVNAYAGVSLTADAGSLVTARSEKRVVMWVGDGGATDGTEVVPPVYGGNPQRVAWAGERLLYDVNTGGHPTIVGLTPGRGTAEVIVAQGSAPAATSDGRTVVFDSFETGARAGLWKADADGRHAIHLVPDGLASSPVVTGDDRYVIFMSSRSGVQSPWIVPIDGGSPKPLINRPARPGVGVSADGRSFVFLALDKNPPELVVCDLPACNAPRSYAAPPRPSPINSSPIRWMPDDSGVAYTDATQSNLWVQPFDGKPPHQLTHFTDRIIEDFAWSRDGRRLAIVRSTTTNDIVLFKGLKR